MSFVLLLEFLIDFVSFVVHLIVFYFREFIALIGGAVVFDGRVLQSDGGEQFEVDEFEQHQIEVEEGAHDTIVHVDGQTRGVFEWDDVGDFLVQNLALVVYSFDAHEDLAQGVVFDDEQFEMLQ